MCLGIPGQVVELLNSDSLMSEAIVNFGGLKKKVNVSCISELKIGEYVVVHAGVAIQKMNESEAAKLIDLLNELKEDSQ
jgi:hydrogenase expression/formation protein HypC